MPPPISAIDWEHQEQERRQRTGPTSGAEIDWQQAEHGEQLAAPDEITVERIDDFEAKALRLSAAIDAERRRSNSPWR